MEKHLQYADRLAPLPESNNQTRQTKVCNPGKIILILSFLVVVS